MTSFAYLGWRLTWSGPLHLTTVLIGAAVLVGLLAVLGRWAMQTWWRD